MERARRVLVVDDNERWREILTETLEQHSYHADAVATTAEALQRLSDSLYHLLVLDIRMEDADERNVEGMHLLKTLRQKGTEDAVHVIMLSAYGTREQMRAAFRDYDVEDFLTKEEFDDIEFIQLVEGLFATKFKLNLELAVHWQQVGGPGQVMQNKKFDGRRISRETPALAELAATELDDLLCRLFYQAESLLVHPLTSGHSDAGVLWAQPFLSSGGGHAVVVKFGSAPEIDAEHSNFSEYVQPFVGGARNTTVLAYRHTLRLGGIVYSLLGAAGERLDDFSGFYRRADLEAIKALLDRLFFDTCGGWYANPGRLQLYNLTEEYQRTLGFSLKRLEELLAERFSKSVQGKHKLVFRALEGERTFLNPLLALGDKQLPRPTYRCITHGDFNPHNVLVDRVSHPWLIDFLRTGPGHILRDVALLDAAIRIQLLAPEEATLAERLQIEELLCGTERFGQLDRLAERLPNTNPALAKAYATSLHLRGIAHRLVQQNPTDDMSEYHIAVLYQSLNMIRFFSLPMAQREHALLSACLLVESLGL